MISPELRANAQFNESEYFDVKKLVFLMFTNFAINEYYWQLSGSCYYSPSNGIFARSKPSREMTPPLECFECNVVYTAVKKPRVNYNSY